MNEISLPHSPIKLNKNQVLCREGDIETDLYLVTDGKLLICSRSGKMVTPLAYLTRNDYFGEMSFFDGKPRSADVIAIEETTLIKIFGNDLKDQVPTWLLIMAKQMTQKLRNFDEVIRDQGVKKRKTAQVSPLSIEEQRHYFQLLNS